MKKNLLLFITLLLPFVGYSQEVVNVHSKKMNREIKNAIYLPDNYSKDKSYPVLYLLNGYSGDHTSWGKTKPNLKEEITKYGIIVVCPDGQNSWYWDSPVDEKMQFDTYVSSELVEYMDANYSTIKSPKGRAITGLSMGGHGGLWLGINHPDVFGACGSMSGGVDIRPFPNNWNLKDRLGTQKENRERWEDYTIIDQLYKIEPNTLEIIIDCGFEDFFFKVNEKLHQEMLYMNIKHDYITRPGAHNHDYWRNAIDYQLLFFSKFFNKQ